MQESVWNSTDSLSPVLSLPYISRYKEALPLKLLMTSDNLANYTSMTWAIAANKPPQTARFRLVFRPILLNLYKIFVHKSQIQDLELRVFSTW